jgi:hypothetical protein
MVNKHLDGGQVEHVIEEFGKSTNMCSRKIIMLLFWEIWWDK